MLDKLRRLLRIRTAEEKAMAVEKGQRWLKIFRQRALATGQLPPEDVLKDSGLPADHRFWKQDNTQPADGFAVNLDISLNGALGLTDPQGEELRAVDDFGRHVPLIPIMATGSTVGFDFANMRPCLDLRENQTPHEFLQLLGQLAKELFDREDELEDIEIYSDRSVMDVPIKRLYWNSSQGYWQITLDFPDES